MISKIGMHMHFQICGSDTCSMLAASEVLTISHNFEVRKLRPVNKKGLHAYACIIPSSMDWVPLHICLPVRHIPDCIVRWPYSQLTVQKLRCKAQRLTNSTLYIAPLLLHIAKNCWYCLVMLIACLALQRTQVCMRCSLRFALTHLCTVREAHAVRVQNLQRAHHTPLSWRCRHCPKRTSHAGRCLLPLMLQLAT